MKLLFITEFSPGPQQVFTGGVEARTFFITQQLRRRHKVDIISRRPTHVSAGLSSFVSRLWFMLIAIIKGLNFQPDIVEGSNVVCYFPAWLVAKLKHARAVAWVPDILGLEWHHFGVAGIFGRLAEWASLKLPWDHYLALSRQTQTKLLNLGIPPQKVTVVYPGVNRSEFSLSAVKRRLPTLCVIARLVPYKHVDQAINLIYQLKSSLPEIRLLIIGAGPQAPTLRRQVDYLGLKSQVYFKANLPRFTLVKALTSCHLLVHFSTVEGFGLALLEALAAGLPYVAYDTPVNREVTHSGQGGILVPVENISAAAQAVKKLLTNKTLYRQKVAAGQALLSYYSWLTSARQTESVYRSLAFK